MGNLGAINAYFDRNSLSKTMLTFSILMTMIVYYFMYIACYQLWTFMSFGAVFSNQINDTYFFYINTMELLSFIFVRTRSTIKYLPKFLTVSNLAFLMYLNSYMYPAQFEALNVLSNFSYFIFMYFLMKYEQDAINNWNPFSTWTPSETNPRCGYHHIILSSEYSIGFDIFTLAMPLRFRETFPTQSQRSFDILT